MILPPIHDKSWIIRMTLTVTLIKLTAGERKQKVIITSNWSIVSIFIFRRNQSNMIQEEQDQSIFLVVYRILYLGLDLLADIILLLCIMWRCWKLIFSQIFGIFPYKLPWSHPWFTWDSWSSASQLEQAKGQVLGVAAMKCIRALV